MKFHRVEIPIATSMLDLGQKASHPFQHYFCCWAAFNNIYVLIGARQGLVVQPQLDKTGTQNTISIWGYSFPKVTIPREHELIFAAINS